MLRPRPALTASAPARRTSSYISRRHMQDGSAEPTRHSEEDDPVQRRDFISAAAAVMAGATSPAFEQWLPRMSGPAAPPPARIGPADIARIRENTSLLHSLGNQIGGHA